MSSPVKHSIVWCKKIQFIWQYSSIRVKGKQEGQGLGRKIEDGESSGDSCCDAGFERAGFGRCWEYIMEVLKCIVVGRL